MTSDYGDKADAVEGINPDGVAEQQKESPKSMKGACLRPGKPSDGEGKLDPRMPP
jgi:hypothetical protein